MRPRSKRSDRTRRRGAAPSGSPDATTHVDEGCKPSAGAHPLAANLKDRGLAGLEHKAVVKEVTELLFSDPTGSVLAGLEFTHHQQVDSAADGEHLAQAVEVEVALRVGETVKAAAIHNGLKQPGQRLEKEGIRRDELGGAATL